MGAVHAHIWQPEHPECLDQLNQFVDRAGHELNSHVLASSCLLLETGSGPGVPLAAGCTRVRFRRFPVPRRCRTTALQSSALGTTKSWHLPTRQQALAVP